MEESSNKISVQNLIRLKHALNESIKYGGYNAKEIRELEEFKEEQHISLLAELANIKKVWWTIPEWVLIAFSLVSAGFLFYFETLSYRVYSLIALIYGVTQVAYRQGVYSGFGRGYREGYVKGIHRVLGISPEEAKEIHKAGIEMEMDEKLVKKFDEQQDNSKSH
jgi:hypothetical protein